MANFNSGSRLITVNDGFEIIVRVNVSPNLKDYYIYECWYYELFVCMSDFKNQILS